MKLIRPLVIFLGLIAVWQIVVLATGAPHYILPGPARVARALSTGTVGWRKLPLYSPARSGHAKACGVGISDARVREKP